MLCRLRLRQTSSVRTVMPAKPVSRPENSPPTTVSPATPRRPDERLDKELDTGWTRGAEPGAGDAEREHGAH